KSTDGGVSWTALGNISTPAISRIIINPKDRKNIFVAGNIAGRGSEAAQLGVFVSTDGGTTFANTLKDISVNEIDIIPSSPTTVFAAAGDPFGKDLDGLYISEAGGAAGSWKRINQLPIGNGIGRVTVSVAAKNPAIVYSAFEISAFGPLQGMYKSTDGG